MLKKGTCPIKKTPDNIKKVLKEEDSRSSFLDIDKNETIVSWTTDYNGHSIALWHIADWDSEQLGVKCAKINKVILKNNKTTKNILLELLFTELSTYARVENIKNIFFRTPMDNLSIIKSAEQAGFRTIGVHLDFILPIIPDKSRQIEKNVRIAENGDIENIMQISSFEDYRFHRDGRFSEDKIAGLWSASIKNAFNDWADTVYVYEESDGIKGFIIITTDSSIVDKRSRPAKRIFLIAVLPENRKEGIGRALIQSAAYYSNLDASPYLVVGTPCTNHAGVSFYQACNFKLYRTYHELSLWLNEV